MSLFTLTMINVIAIDSLRSIPMSAHYGFSLVFYLLSALIFFIPSALISAELSTGWPQTGGIYVWVREAFGIPIGFLVIWLQWITIIENLSYRKYLKSHEEPKAFFCVKDEDLLCSDKIIVREYCNLHKLWRN